MISIGYALSKSIMNTMTSNNDILFRTTYLLLKRECLHDVTPNSLGLPNRCDDVFFQIW